MDPNNITVEAALKSVIKVNVDYVKRIESERQEVLRSIREHCLDTKKRAVSVMMMDIFAKGQKPIGELLTMDDIKQKPFYNNKAIFPDHAKAELKKMMDTYDVQNETLFCIITKSVLNSHVVEFFQVEIKEIAQ
jgi:hypothetical protein